ncbi:MAG: sigma-70 family RNA polymerase sigma factor [Bdellovibrionales bacterium]|nr:sigma-70 family RNA polymerase sigma factor [Bdellovibrionales bacterium]
MAKNARQLAEQDQVSQGSSGSSTDVLNISEDPSSWLEEHGNYLYRYAYMRVNSQETAEDLVQEALLAAVRGYKNFERRSSVRTWLVGILKNKIIDYLRRSSRKEKNEILEEDNETLDRHFNRFGVWNRVLPNWASEPNELLERKEFMRAFEGCLRKVPEKTRQAFMLKTFENVETEEVCNILGITSSNLWVLLHRCRLVLRECLEKNWAGLEQ